MQAPASARLSRWTAGAVCLGILYVLLFRIHYTIGYGSAPSTFFQEMWRLWWGFNNDWTHGMIVPFISLALVWRDRERLRAIPIRGENWAIAPLIFGFLLFWVGFKADLMYIGYAAVMLLIASAIVWLLGWPMFKAVMFPWAFLMFTWPLLILTDILAVKLQSVMAEISFRFLNLIGMDVLKQGSGILSAPDFAKGIEAGAKFKVDIAMACSGIRSLFALMMISCIYAHLTLRRWWSKWLLFALALPLAVLGNFVRVMMLTFGTLWFGSEFAIGPSEFKPSTFHMTAGFVVFGVALGAMVGTSSWLARRERGDPAPSRPSPPPASPAPAQ